jgi:6-phosphogluconate dehydrogenase
MKSDIGVVGLGVMGRNLALNMEHKGYTVSVYDRIVEQVPDFVDDAAKGKEKIIPAYTFEEFVKSLKKPKKSHDND